MTRRSLFAAFFAVPVAAVAAPFVGGPKVVETDGNVSISNCDIGRLVVNAKGNVHVSHSKFVNSGITVVRDEV